MKKKTRLTLPMFAGIVTFIFILGWFSTPSAFSSQRCFKCCGSGVWHTDNKVPCSGKGCNYCIKCNGCGGSGQISDTAKRCDSCKGLGQIHSGKKTCTGAGCLGCKPCKTCDTKGWISG